MRRRAAAFALAAGFAVPWAACHAASTRYCEPSQPLSAEQKDKLFRFGAVIKAELAASGRGMAIVARSGLDLSRFQMRYSHAGFSLRDSPETPWAVRQLYFACDEKRPRLYDQGLSAFLLGSQEAAIGYVSVLLLPPPDSAELQAAALDKPRALQLLGAEYSANAYPFSVQFQNCNQWVLELLASARGRLAGAETLRARAQAWLQAQGYAPTVFDVGWRPLMWFSTLIPWVHDSDHPASDTAQNLYRVSMPASIEAFVQATVPGATRLEFCHTETQVVVHRGFSPIAEGCRAGEGDTVIALD